MRKAIKTPVTQEYIKNKLKGMLTESILAKMLDDTKLIGNNKVMKRIILEQRN